MDAVTECKRAFGAALRCLDARAPPAMLVRELLATAGCDTLHDMSAIRGVVAADVGEAAMRRIRSFDETFADNARACQATFHHGEWIRAELVNAGK